VYLRFFLVIIFLTVGVQADVPPRDLKKIRHLFEVLVDHHDYAYTIFGSKPMALADFCLEVPPHLPFYRWMRSHYLMFKRRASLKAWYKYRDQFKFENFIFLDEEKDLISSLALILINKNTLLRVLQAHKTVFKEELGDSFSPQSFLEQLDKREVSFAQATHHNQKLIGIMLGYGLRNATLFKERCDLKKAIAKRKKANLAVDERLTQQLSDLEAHCGDFSDLEEEAIVRPLYFLADLSHPETISLKQRYEKERVRLIELRKRPNFLDLTFDELLLGGGEFSLEILVDEVLDRE
jgi:hypothetical protein